MSFKEVSAWIVITANLIVAGFFANTLANAEGIQTEGQILPYVLLFVGIVVVAHIVFAILNPKSSDREDERDRDIERKGERAASMTLGGFALFVLFWSMAHGDWMIANIIFVGLITSEMVKNIWQITLYRLTA